jgi:myosin heavy subunit
MRIVIAINPFQRFTHLYTESQRSMYSNKLDWSKGGGIEPHVYECSSLSYKGVAFNKVYQSILVSGEFGAGKSVGNPTSLVEGRRYERSDHTCDPGSQTKSG